MKKIKDHILKKSIFAVSKSGTISLEISKRKIPSIIIYKMNFLNFLIVKILVKIKYANILNIAAEQMIIPELLQSKCNPKEIFKLVSNFLEDPNKIKKQISNTEKVLETLEQRTYQPTWQQIHLGKVWDFKLQRLQSLFKLGISPSRKSITSVINLKYKSSFLLISKYCVAISSAGTLPNFKLFGSKQKIPKFFTGLNFKKILIWFFEHYCITI